MRVYIYGRATFCSSVSTLSALARAGEGCAPPSPPANFLLRLQTHVPSRNRESRESAVAATAHTHFTYYILRFPVHASRSLPARGGNRHCCCCCNSTFSRNLCSPNRRQKFFFSTPALQMRHMNDCPFIRSETCKGELAAGVKKRSSFWENVSNVPRLGFDMEHEPASRFVKSPKDIIHI
jgi:hypothetical protein